MIQYHVLNCLIPEAFIDDDILPFLAQFIPDDDFWQHSIRIPSHRIYGKGDGNFVILPTPLRVDEDSWQHTVLMPPRRIYSRSINAPLPLPSLHIDEDSWQQSLTLNLNTKVSLWHDNDESKH